MSNHRPCAKAATMMVESAHLSELIVAVKSILRQRISRICNVQVTLQVFDTLSLTLPFYQALALT
jgi:hypothetical protein